MSKSTTTEATSEIPPNGGTELNGGTLVRAAKVCDCKIPNLVANKIEAGDEWTCVCKQGWRARVSAGKPLHWKRISTKPRKPRKAKDQPTADGAGTSTEGLVPPKTG